MVYILDCHLNLDDLNPSSYLNHIIIKGAFIVTFRGTIFSEHSNNQFIVDGGKFEICGGELDINSDIIVKNNGTLYLAGGSIGIKERFTVSTFGTVLIHEGSYLITAEKCLNHQSEQIELYNAHIGNIVYMNGTWIHEAQSLSTGIDNNFFIYKKGNAIWLGNAPLTGIGKITNYGLITLPSGSKLHLGVSTSHYGKLIIDNSCLSVSETFTMQIPSSRIYLIQASFIVTGSATKLTNGKIQAKDAPAFPSNIIVTMGDLFQFIPIVGNIAVTIVDGKFNQYSNIDTTQSFRLLGEGKHTWARGSMRIGGTEYTTGIKTYTNVGGCGPILFGKNMRLNGRIAINTCFPIYMENPSSILREGRMELFVESSLVGPGTLWNSGFLRVSPGTSVLVGGATGGDFSDDFVSF